MYFRMSRVAFYRASPTMADVIVDYLNPSLSRLRGSPCKIVFFSQSLLETNGYLSLFATDGRHYLFTELQHCNIHPSAFRFSLVYLL